MLEIIATIVGVVGTGVLSSLGYFIVKVHKGHIDIAKINGTLEVLNVKADEANRRLTAIEAKTDDALERLGRVEGKIEVWNNFKITQ